MRHINLSLTFFWRNAPFPLAKNLHDPIVGRISYAGNKLGLSGMINKACVRRAWKERLVKEL